MTDPFFDDLRAFAYRQYPAARAKKMSRTKFVDLLSAEGARINSVNEYGLSEAQIGIVAVQIMKFCFNNL
jgi:ankyrin repeat protein